MERPEPALAADWPKVYCLPPTSDATAPGKKDSATIRPLISSLQRRRLAPTRPRGSEMWTIWSTIDANRSALDGSHLAAQPAGDNVGTKDRSRSRVAA
jgi:hypothetical protein